MPGNQKLTPPSSARAARGPQNNANDPNAQNTVTRRYERARPISAFNNGGLLFTGTGVVSAKTQVDVSVWQTAGNDRRYEGGCG